MITTRATIARRRVTVVLDDDGHVTFEELDVDAERVVARLTGVASPFIEVADRVEAAWMTMRGLTEEALKSVLGVTTGTVRTRQDRFARTKPLPADDAAYAAAAADIPSVRAMVALRQGLPALWRKLFRADEAPCVREAAARNDDSDLEDLLVLIGDTSPDVRCAAIHALARRAQTGELPKGDVAAALRIAATDGDYKVRVAVATVVRTGAVPLDTVAALLADRRRHVRTLCAWALQPAHRELAMARIHVEPHPNVLAGFGRSKALTDEDIRGLAASAEATHRLLATYSKRLGDVALLALANDPNPMVATSAQGALAQRHITRTRRADLLRSPSPRKVTP